MHYIIFEKIRHVVSTFLHAKLSDPETRDDVIAYCSGHILTTTFFLGSMTQIILQLAGKIFLAISIGVIGGAAGLLGKDLYEHFKGKIKTKKNKK